MKCKVRALPKTQNTKKNKTNRKEKHFLKLGDESEAKHSTSRSLRKKKKERKGGKRFKQILVM